MFSAYFVNWAQYRPAPYTHTPSNLSPIVGRLDEILYSFIYFCPPAGTNPMPYWAIPPYGNCNDAMEYQLLSVEPKDSSFMQTINGYKSQNPGLKLMLSVGGWNFPSEYFSKMVSSSANRQKFITSAKQWLQQYSANGIDIDWEYPCSPARTNPVEISCSDFRVVNDAGGSCPADSNNFPQFLKDLRSGLGSTYRITVASQAAKQNEINMDIADATASIDFWHIMSYDYAVSDLPDSSAAVMSPNCPLYTPAAPAVLMSLNDTVYDYLAVGVPKSKIMIGVPYYGHTWYQPSLVGSTDWQKFGNKGVVQGSCCGPFTQTYGGKPGKGCSMCGTMMYSEILAGAPDTYYDNKTQSAIGFWSKQGADNYTPAGTWVTYNDESSLKVISQYCVNMGLKGVFAFDTSMDTVTTGGQWTYKLSNTIADQLGK